MNATLHESRFSALRVAGQFAVLGALMASVLFPERFLPFVQGIEVEGTFAGDPVEMPWTGETPVPYRIVVTMETGLCEIVEFDVSGGVARHFLAQEVTYRGRIHPGGSVRLLARLDAKGYYHLRMGPLAMWGPALMGARVAALAVFATFVAARLFGVRIDWRQWDARRRRALPVVAATTALTGLVLYTIVHEAGHLLFGWLWGGTPAWSQVSWTVFSGEEPHAAFRSLPDEAVPWMGAGGMLLPTFVGCVLVGAGFWWGARVAPWMQLALVTAGALLLLGNLGLVADTDHTLPLALHFGLPGVLAEIAALMPVALTLAIYGYIIYRLRTLA